MDASAIQAIQATAIIDAQLKNIPEHSLVLPKDFLLKSTEALLLDPLRQRRKFTTTRPEDFLRYVAAYKRDDTAVFVMPDGTKAVAVLNHGAPENPAWGDDVAILTLKRTPVYAAMVSATQRTLSQQDLIDYLEDWSDELEAYSEIDFSGGMDIRRAITAVRRVKIEAKGSKTVEQGDMRAAISSMEEVEAQGAGDPLPAVLRHLGPVYEGLSAHYVVGRLSVRLDGNTPMFKLRILGLDRLEDRIAREITSLVMEDASYPVFTGMSEG